MKPNPQLILHLALLTLTTQASLIGPARRAGRNDQKPRAHDYARDTRDTRDTSTANCACGYYIPETKLIFTHRVILDPTALDAYNLASGLAKQGWAASNYQLASSPKNINYTSANIRLNTASKALDLYVSGGLSSRKIIASAELGTAIETIRYGSFRFNIKTSSVPGACHGMFFYKDDNNEIDVEILTSHIHNSAVAQDPGIPKPGLQLTVQPLTAGQSARNYRVVPFDGMFDPTKGFREYRFDWTKSGVKYYINGQTYTYSSFTPNAAGQIIVNNWSNGDPYSPTKAANDFPRARHFDSRAALQKMEESKSSKAVEGGDLIIHQQESPIVPVYHDETQFVHEDDTPTEEDLRTLRRVAGKVPWTAYSIAFVELCERFSYYGTTQVFTNFIQQPLPSNSRTGAGRIVQKSGALGLGQRTSTSITNFNAFWAYLMPLFGAYVADRHWGRYKTIMVSIVFSMVGHILLIIAALPDVIARPKASFGVLIVGIVIMGGGTGGFKSNISPLIAEQYKQEKKQVITLPSGERVIVDPVLTISRIYMYFYMMINIGALVGQVTMVYAEHYVGFYLSYLLPTVMFSLCPIILAVCRKNYVKTPATYSVLSRAARLMAFASRGKWSINPIRTYKNLNDGMFWENVKPSKIPLEERPVWMTFDDEWVDEVSRGIKACTVFLYYPLYWITYNQINGNLTSQAAVLNTHGLPNDILSNLNPFSLIILIPIFDLFLYPGLRKIGFNFTPIKKITFGFITGVMAMIWAAVLQYYIYQKSPCGYHAADSKCPPADINVWAQTGSFVLIAISEIFASITGLEYAYTKAPTNMKSLVTSVFLVMSAFSTAIGFAFVTLSNDPLLVWNYIVAAIIATLGAICFWFQFRDLDRDEDRLNDLVKTSYVGGVGGDLKGE
ncbi:hypothetical protein Dda_2278 [Drechslerella dactyloides]|uniref:GH16 domain-containing protein n=1 Tax=Drechslerella dactyloides TaxID=74499 RepID=A0AAD6NM61_DREDA|nr:hypothetical protein Dda_2278 [Drechslerella dactyloides]